MDFEKIKKTMTKEEFLNNYELTSNSGCPYKYGFSDKFGSMGASACIAFKSCKKCWEQALEEENIAFKGDVKMKNYEENKVVEALSLIRDFCKKTPCKECKFLSQGKPFCKIREITDVSPLSYKIDDLKNTIDPPIKVYNVEHKKNGKLYNFISDEVLEKNDMVVCDTVYGEAYGRVVDIFIASCSDYKKCWKVN